ncbi:MAG: phosphate ABC transporter ATP-binding protein [Mogibacterium sp.]|nr:phosphate ABC transporter ATP-binding protein [Mogibacterium sp.]
MESAIEIKNLTVSYDGKVAVDNVSTSFPKKKITSIIGPSGCGKTTLLNCLNGMIREIPDVKVGGEVYLDGKPADRLPIDEWRRRVGIVFQTPMPFPFSVYKNLTYAPKYYGNHDKADLDRIVKENLEMVGLYEEIRDELKKSALKFSGGQQQRICIARALTVEPDVLLLDEPCSALDVKSIAVIEETLMKLKEDYTIIIVTHNIAQAKRLSDKVVFIKDGKLVEEGDAKQVFESADKHETREFLGGIYG